MLSCSTGGRLGGAASTGRLVQAAFQDGLETLIGTGVQGQAAPRGRFHSLGGVLLGQAKDAQAGTKAHLGMRLAVQDALAHTGGGRPHAGGPLDQARGCPLQVLLVALGAVLGDRGGVMRHAAAHMAGHPRAAMEDLQRG